MKQNIDRLLKALWIKACRYENIPVDSQFVTFDKNNPYWRRYDKVMLMRIASIRHIQQEADRMDNIIIW